MAILEFTAAIPSKPAISGLWNVKIPKFVNYNDSRARVRVCAKVKDLEVQFSAPATSEQRRENEEEEKREYYVNTGYAIRTLREELPEMFYRELSFGIYRDDIAFKDPVNTFIGIENYKSIFWALRFHGRLFFCALWLNIVSVWQPSEGVIMIRWIVHGIPRVPWESRGRFDGTSEYKLDKYGKIYEHRVHNIALNSPSKFGMLSMNELIRSVSCPSTPKPTYFEFFPSWVEEFVPMLVKLTMVRVFLTWATLSSPKPEGESSRKA